MSSSKKTAGNTPSTRMQGLLGEFKQLYESRLSKLRTKQESADSEADITAHYDAQIKVYESYVKDLGEQNEVLVNTVEQLEKEANERVSSLEQKLNKAISAAKECNQKAKSFELELQSAVIAKTKHEEIIKELQDKFRRLESRYDEAEDARAGLEHDLNSLVTVISIARRTGEWQLDGVKLRNLEFNRVFGQSVPLKAGLGDANSELNKRAATISQLQAELGAIREDYDHLLETMKVNSSRISTPTCETDTVGTVLYDNEAMLARLRLELSNVMTSRDTLRQEIIARDQQHGSLQREITRLHEELSLKTEESTNHIHTISSLEGNVKQLNAQLSEVNNKCDDLERKLYDRTEMLKIEISRRDIQVRSLNEEITKFETEKKAMESKLQELKISSTSTSSDLTVASEKLSKLETEKSELQSELDKANKAYDSSHLECAQLAAQVARLEAELTSIQQEHISTLNQLDQVSNGMQHLETTTRDKQRTLTDEVIGKQLELSTLRGRVAEYEKKLDDSQKECQEQKQLIDTLKEDYQAAKAKLYTCEAKLSDTDQRLQNTSERLSGTEARLQASNQQLQENRKSADDKEQNLHEELLKKQESIQDLSDTTNKLNVKVSSLETELKTRQTQLSSLKKEHSAKQSKINSLNEELTKLDKQVTELNEAKGVLERKLNEQISLNGNLTATRDLQDDQIKKLTEENGRLGAKARSLQISSQTDTESYDNQLKAFDEQMNKFKQEKVQLQEQIAKLEEQCRKLHDKNEALLEKNRAISLENQSQTRQLSTLTVDFGEKEKKVGHQTQEILALTDQVQRLSAELKLVSNVKDDLNQHMTIREEDSVKKQEKISNLKLKTEQLYEQVRSYEAEIRGLQNQLSQAERKLEQKSRELDRISESNSKLQTQLADQQLLISQSKQSQNETKKSLSSEIRLLEKSNSELKNSLNNYKTQKDQLENEVDSTRNDYNSVTQKLQQVTHEKMELEQNLHKYEVELTVSQQKNKTCQQEVAARDTAILKLQEELDHFEHKYTVTLEDCNDKQESINNLKEKMARLEADKRQLQITINKQTEQINSQAITISELKNELEMSQNEVKRHTASAETLMDEMRMLKSNHTDEIKKYKDDIALVQDLLEVNREETLKLQNSLSHQQGLTAEAENIADQWNKDCLAVRQQLTNRNKLMSEMEKTLDDARDEINRLELCVQQEKKNNQKAAQQIETLEQNMVGSTTHNKELLQEQKHLQNELSECRANLTLKTEDSSKLKKTVKNMEHKVKEKEKDIEHRVEMTKRLDGEINTLQQELTKAHEKIGDYELSVQKLRQKLEQRSTECAESEEKLRYTHDEFIVYKETHQYSNEEVGERDERLRQLEDEIHATSLELSEKNRQLLTVREEQSAQKCSIASLQEKIAEAESEVTRLEMTLRETRDELDATQKKYNGEISALEDVIGRLTQELEVEREAASQLSQELQAREDHIQFTTAECQTLQEQLGHRLEEVNVVEEQLRLLRVELGDREKRENQFQNTIKQLEIDLERFKADLAESRAECKAYAQELAHHEEKRVLMEQTLLTTKDQLKSRVSDNVKQEQTIARLQADNTSLREQTVQLEQDVEEFKQLVDGLETELDKKSKEKDIWFERENSTKLSLQRVQNDLKDSEERFRKLDTEFTEVDAKLQACHADLAKEQQKCREFDRMLTSYKKFITELQDETEQLTTQNKNLTNDLKSSEELNKKLQNDLDSIGSNLNANKESLVEKEGQLRMALLNLDGCEKEKANALQRIEKLEATIKQISNQKDSIYDQQKTLETSSKDKDREIAHLKSDISSLQSNLDETVAQLNEKTKTCKQLKSRIDQLEMNNKCLADEVAGYERKTKNMKQDIKKLQEFNTACKADLDKYEKQIQLIHDELQAANNRNKQSLEEVAMKEEELVLARVEIATLSEKLALKNQDTDKLEEEAKVAKNNHRIATDELATLQAALDDARSNSNRLHRESEQVVRNVNGWVDEQKRANEKLASKLREQTDAIRHLQNEKRSMTEEMQSTSAKIKMLESTNNELKTEQMKLKSLQEHSSRQQSLLRQLQAKLEEYELGHSEDVKAKNAIIEDLQQQLKLGTDNASLLNNQINILQKQNSQLAVDLERETGNRNTLEATIEQKDDLIRNLRNQMPLSTSLRGSSRTEKTGKSPNGNGEAPAAMNLDKTYWIQRVGELSMQLQQSSEYWSEKVGSLQAQLENK